MIPAPLIFAGVMLLLTCSSVQAQEFFYNGLADFRLVQPSSQHSWTDGGEGKLRYNGGSNAGPDFHIGEIAVDGRAQLTPEFAVMGTARYAPDQHKELDLLEGYTRYRPAATSDVQWQVKLGAFFPPISLENEGVAWSSPWTLTPSAINSWVGEELRTIGSETSVEWRHETGSLQLLGALFGWNGPAGTLLANRGWSMGDRYTTLLDNLRQPDLVGSRQRRPLPYETEPFLQIGDRPSWYTGLAARQDDIGRLTLLYYDNEADPAQPSHGGFGWRTKFTSLGLDTGIGDWVLLSQAMTGTTEVASTPAQRSITRFRAAYLLAGRYFGDWSVAGRVDFFGTHEEHSNLASPELSERGHAYTAAVSWRPVRWVRLTAEALQVDSYRQVRQLEGLSPRAVENQFQLSARFFF